MSAPPRNSLVSSKGGALLSVSQQQASTVLALSALQTLRTRRTCCPLGPSTQKGASPWGMA